MCGEKRTSAQKGKESRDVGRKVKNEEKAKNEEKVKNGMKEKKEEIETADGGHGGRWNEIRRK